MTSTEGTVVEPCVGTVLFVYPPGHERELYASALNEAGFTTMLAATMPAADELLHSAQRPDVVVMDLMPDPAAAWAFIEHRHGHASEVPLIVLTSLIRHDRVNRRKARAVGCAAFVAKPCSLRQLVDVVTRVHAGARGLEIAGYSSMDPDERLS